MYTCLLGYSLMVLSTFFLTFYLVLNSHVPNFPPHLIFVFMQRTIQLKSILSILLFQNISIWTKNFIYTMPLFPQNNTISTIATQHHNFYCCNFFFVYLCSQRWDYSIVIIILYSIHGLGKSTTQPPMTIHGMPESIWILVCCEELHARS